MRMCQSQARIPILMSFWTLIPCHPSSSVFSARERDTDKGRRGGRDRRSRARELALIPRVLGISSVIKHVCTPETAATGRTHSPLFILVVGGSGPRSRPFRSVSGPVIGFSGARGGSPRAWAPRGAGHVRRGARTRTWVRPRQPSAGHTVGTDDRLSRPSSSAWRRRGSPGRARSPPAGPPVSFNRPARRAGAPPPVTRRGRRRAGPPRTPRGAPRRRRGPRGPPRSSRPPPPRRPGRTRTPGPSSCGGGSPPPRGIRTAGHGGGGGPPPPGAARPRRGPGTLAVRAHLADRPLGLVHEDGLVRLQLERHHEGVPGPLPAEPPEDLGDLPQPEGQLPVPGLDLVLGQARPGDVEVGHRRRQVEHRPPPQRRRGPGNLPARRGRGAGRHPRPPRGAGAWPGQGRPRARGLGARARPRGHLRACR